MSGKGGHGGGSTRPGDVTVVVNPLDRPIAARARATGAGADGSAQPVPEVEAAHLVSFLASQEDGGLARKLARKRAALEALVVKAAEEGQADTAAKARAALASPELSSIEAFARAHTKPITQVVKGLITKKAIGKGSSTGLTNAKDLYVAIEGGGLPEFGDVLRVFGMLSRGKQLGWALEHTKKLFRGVQRMGLPDCAALKGFNGDGIGLSTFGVEVMALVLGNDPDVTPNEACRIAKAVERAGTTLEEEGNPWLPVDEDIEAMLIKLPEGSPNLATRRKKARLLLALAEATEDAPRQPHAYWWGLNVYVRPNKVLPAEVMAGITARRDKRDPPGPFTRCARCTAGPRAFLGWVATLYQLAHVIFVSVLVVGYMVENVGHLGEDLTTEELVSQSALLSLTPISPTQNPLSWPVMYLRLYNFSTFAMQVFLQCKCKDLWLLAGCQIHATILFRDTVKNRLKYTMRQLFLLNYAASVLFLIGMFLNERADREDFGWRFAAGITIVQVVTGYNSLSGFGTEGVAAPAGKKEWAKVVLTDFFLRNWVMLILSAAGTLAMFLMIPLLVLALPCLCCGGEKGAEIFMKLVKAMPLFMNPMGCLTKFSCLKGRGL